MTQGVILPHSPPSIPAYYVNTPSYTRMHMHILTPTWSCSSLHTCTLIWWVNQYLRCNGNVGRKALTPPELVSRTAWSDPMAVTSPGLQLMIIFIICVYISISIYLSIYLSIYVCKKLVKNGIYSFSEATLMSSVCLFFLTSSTQAKVFNFTVTTDEEKQKILTFEKLKAENICPFCLKNDWNK